MSTELSSLVTEDVNDKGVITLNRPNNLNALNLDMLMKIFEVLKKWEVEKSLVIMKATGRRAFCAGGDMVFVTNCYKTNARQKVNQVFQYVNANAALIFFYKIPYIALVDGIVMGGGAALSVIGQHAVVTENALFAMPETQLGFYPNAGGTYFLSRLEGNLGLYLGLTGQRLKGSDIVNAGLAKYYCKSENLENLINDLLNSSNREETESILNKYNEKTIQKFSLEPFMEKINECFSAITMEGIISRLEKDGSDWAKDTIKVLNRMSPTSLKVTIMQLNMGKELNLKQCLQMEYRLNVNFMNGSDIHEGVRAILQDKDRNPKWNPPTLSEVTEKYVESQFLEVPDEVPVIRHLHKL